MTGDNLKRLRESQGLSIKELADKCDLSDYTIWRIETNTSKRPYPDTLNRIAKALGVTVNELTEETPTEEQVKVMDVLAQINSNVQDIKVNLFLKDLYEDEMNWLGNSLFDADNALKYWDNERTIIENYTWFKSLDLEHQELLLANIDSQIERLKEGRII